MFASRHENARKVGNFKHEVTRRSTDIWEGLRRGHHDVLKAGEWVKAGTKLTANRTPSRDVRAGGEGKHERSRQWNNYVLQRERLTFKPASKSSINQSEPSLDLSLTSITRLARDPTGLLGLERVNLPQISVSSAATQQRG